MNSLDLTLFAEHSAKVPPHLLSALEQEEASVVPKVLLAHFLDFCFSFVCTIFLSIAFSWSIQTLMTTNSLLIAFNRFHSLPLEMNIFPFVLLSYFTFFYFMNQGQTPGLKLTGKRIELKSWSKREAFSWGVNSTFLCLSLGLTLPLQWMRWKEVKASDHLYAELVRHKDDYSFNLLSKTIEVGIEDEFVGDHLTEAA